MRIINISFRSCLRYSVMKAHLMRAKCHVTITAYKCLPMTRGARGRFRQPGSFGSLFLLSAHPLLPLAFPISLGAAAKRELMTLYFRALLMPLPYKVYRRGCFLAADIISFSRRLLSSLLGHRPGMMISPIYTGRPPIFPQAALSYEAVICYEKKRRREAFDDE